MSPRSTFHRVGSSSRLVERRKRPRRVRRTESVASKSSLARGVRMVRNFRSMKSFPCRPGRVWQKRMGEPRRRRTVMATTANSGSRIMRPRSDVRMSRRRVKLKFNLAQSLIVWRHGAVDLENFACDFLDRLRVTYLLSVHHSVISPLVTSIG